MFRTLIQLKEKILGILESTPQETNTDSFCLLMFWPALPTFANHEFCGRVSKFDRYEQSTGSLCLL